MEVFALIGLMSVVLSSAVTIALPICLAVWVSFNWLWLYAVYGVIVLLFLLIATCGEPKDKGKDER